MDSVNPTQPRCLSPIICNNRSLSAILYAFGIIIGIGVILAAYDPSSLTFVDFTPSATEITACYLAGSLIALISCIQLIRLSGGFLMCCNFNASTPDEVDGGGHDKATSTTTFIGDGETPDDPLLCLLRHVERLAGQPVWNKENPTQLRPEIEAIFSCMSSTLMQAERSGSLTNIAKFIDKTATLFKLRHHTVGSPENATRLTGFATFINYALQSLSNEPLVRLLHNNASQDAPDAFRAGVTNALIAITERIDETNREFLVKKFQLLVPYAPMQALTAVTDRLNGHSMPDDIKTSLLHAIQHELDRRAVSQS